MAEPIVGQRNATGRTLIGGFDNSGPSYAFANLVKMMGTPVPDIAGYAWQGMLDRNGYPNFAPNNRLGTNLRSPINIPPIWGNQQLVIKWTGTCGIVLLPAAVSRLRLGAGVTNHSTLPTFLSVSGTNGRITFNFAVAPGAGTNYQFIIASGPVSGMGNLVFCRASDEAAIDSNSNAFNPDFLAQFVELGPKTFRGLDWSGVFGHQSRLSYRASEGSMSFFADRFPPEIWCGAASGTGTANDPYVCALPNNWGGLVDGAAVTFQATNANAGSRPQLKLPVLGNIRITDNGPNDIGRGGIAAGDVWTVVYSSVYNYWTGRKGGFQQRVPIEQHVDFCNEVNAHLWYNICHRYSPTDGLALASLVKARLRPTLSFYVELANEAWNANSPITSFIQNLGLLFGFPASGDRQLMGAYGLLVKRMMDAITSGWGGKDARLQRVMAFQAYGANGINGANNLYRFKGADLAPVSARGTGNATYKAFTDPIGGVGANYTSSPNRPIDVCDVLSMATYFSGGQLLQFEQNYAPGDLALAANPAILSLRKISGVSKASTGAVLYTSDPGYVTGARINLQNIGGMTQLNGMNVTLRRDTPTSYSMFTDATMNTPVDTSEFTAHTSGGTSGLYPFVGGLTNAADQYAAPGGSATATALAWVDSDIRSGAQYPYGSSLLSQRGTQSLYDLKTNIYPSIEAMAASYDASRPSIGLAPLTVEAYEGGHGSIGPSSSACKDLGISTAYSTKIDNLLNAYKNNPLFAALVTDQFKQFLSFSHFKTPAWYGHPGPSPWAHFAGDTYTGPPFGTPYQSWYANVSFNH